METLKLNCVINECNDVHAFPMRSFNYFFLNVLDKLNNLLGYIAVYAIAQYTFINYVFCVYGHVLIFSGYKTTSYQI